MLKNACLLCLSLLVYLNTYAQGKRYRDCIFNDVNVVEDQSYATEESKADKKANLFDLYQPKNDNAGKRPLIIWMHGGGFKFGSKKAKGIKLWCKTFAQRGYVCAAINYSLSKGDPLFNFGELQKSAYYAVQDARMAVAYFKINAAKYGIDPDKIILAGNSAGGMIGLQAAYSSNKELASQVGIAEAASEEPAAGRLKVAAVINYWGGIFNLNWLKNTTVPIVNVYGSNDGIISPDNKKGALYGALAIHREADALHIPNAVKVFEGYSHELQKHFNPIFQGGKETEERWMEAAQFTADFLYKKVVRQAK